MVVLLDSSALEKSNVVANSCMNRERNLAGVNSYEKDLGLNPLDFLKQTLDRQKEAAWLDLCCGSGRALIQAAVLDQRVKVTGVDLIPMFDSVPPGVSSLRLLAASLDTWETADRFDLITCVHGLHYIGDKLGLLGKARTWLKKGGQFMAHLDYGNLVIEGRTSSAAQIGKDLRRAGFQYVSHRHLLTYSAQIVAQPPIPYRYLGADDKAGPNYTGQPAVNSYYERVAL